MGADCKSVGLRLPRFESWICHRVQRLFPALVATSSVGIVRSESGPPISVSSSRATNSGTGAARALDTDPSIGHVDIGNPQRPKTNTKYRADELMGLTHPGRT
jgi:hypothetical protein